MTEAAPEFDTKLLEILVCPQSKSDLVYDAAAQELKCAASRLAYPIREGIPIMLIDEARMLEDAEVNALERA